MKKKNKRAAIKVEQKPSWEFKRNLTPAEAASFLNCSRKKIYSLLQSGELVGIPLNRTCPRSPIRIPRESLEDWELAGAKKWAEDHGFSFSVALGRPGSLPVAE
jgi:excisionase family DNA binding protein